MKMTDILPAAGWAELEKDIHERFGVNAHAHDAEGAPFTGYEAWGNRLCPALRRNRNAATSVCAVVNQAVRAESRQESKTIVTDCDAGLMIIAVPVIVRGEFVGMLGGCGGLRDGAEPESFLVEKLTGLSEDQVTELSSDMRQYTEDEAQAIARYIEARVAEVVRAYEAKH
ncbi:MAG: PocR ligand-binding domain-containing protein [Desulfovibrio sp.]